MRKQRNTLGGYFILPHPVHAVALLTLVRLVTREALNTLGSDS